MKNQEWISEDIRICNWKERLVDDVHRTYYSPYHATLNNFTFNYKDAGVTQRLERRRKDLIILTSRVKI
jgi:hypothetical protein